MRITHGEGASLPLRLRHGALDFGIGGWRVGCGRRFPTSGGGYQDLYG